MSLSLKGNILPLRPSDTAANERKLPAECNAEGGAYCTFLTPCAAKHRQRQETTTLSDEIWKAGYNFIYIFFCYCIWFCISQVMDISKIFTYE